MACCTLFFDSLGDLGDRVGYYIERVLQGNVFLADDEEKTEPL